VLIAIWAGLATGAIYALVAVTNNITLSQLGVFNFAQTQFLVAGAYLAYQGIEVWGLPWYGVAIGSGVCLASAGWAQERFTIRPLGGLVAGHSATLVTTVGVATVVQGALVLKWGTTPLTVPFFGGDGSFDFLGGRLQPVDVFLFGLTACLCACLYAASSRTRWGLSGRAVTTDEDAARLRGVNVEWLSSSSFMLAGFLGGVLGPFIAAKTGVAVELSGSLLIYGFVALAIGGFGSYIGAAVGGLAVGLIQSLVTRYFELDWFPITLFGILLLVLIVRPTGVFGARATRSL